MVDLGTKPCESDSRFCYLNSFITLWISDLSEIFDNKFWKLRRNADFSLTKWKALGGSHRKWERMVWKVATSMVLPLSQREEYLTLLTLLFQTHNTWMRMVYLSSSHISLLGNITELFFRMAVHLFCSRNSWICAIATWLLASKEPESGSCSHQGEQTLLLKVSVIIWP